MRKLNKKGFTLIELMITVAIIGILAAVAIPSFYHYNRKSRAAEAHLILSGIASSEIAYLAENNVYQACAATPAGAPSDTLRPWATNAGYDNIGYAPKNASVLHTYTVTVAGMTFTATAVGDLDNDSTTSLYDVTESQGVRRVTANNIF